MNARSETIFEKPSFRHAIRSKRCLVIVDGFFEWRHEGRKRYPYYLTLKSRNIFTLGGIWDSWTNPVSGEETKTFSIVTTEANELMAKVHNSRKRMPLILPKEQENAWLDLELNKETLSGIMQPYNQEDINAMTVENKISRLGFNTSDNSVNKLYEYPELPELEY